MRTAPGASASPGGNLFLLPVYALVVLVAMSVHSKIWALLSSPHSLASTLVLVVISGVVFKLKSCMDRSWNIQLDVTLSYAIGGLIGDVGIPRALLAIGAFALFQMWVGAMGKWLHNRRKRRAHDATTPRSPDYKKLPDRVWSKMTEAERRKYCELEGKEYQ